MTSVVSHNHIGKRGTWVIPAALRRQYGFGEGDAVAVEARPDGILLKRVTVTVPDNPWREWFALTKKTALSPDEIAAFRAEGRR